MRRYISTNEEEKSSKKLIKKSSKSANIDIVNNSNLLIKQV